jgi:hypothetical protein
MILDQIRELLKTSSVDGSPQQIIIEPLTDGGFRMIHVPVHCTYDFPLTAHPPLVYETVSKEERSVIDHSEVKGNITFIRP